MVVTFRNQISYLSWHDINNKLYQRDVWVYTMNSNRRKGDRNHRVTCSLCNGGLSISTDSDLRLHDEIWHHKNSIDYFIRYKKSD